MLLRYFLDTESYEWTRLVCFSHQDGNVQTLFQCDRGGETDGDENSSDEKAIKDVISALKLEETTPVQFLAGLFARMFCYKSRDFNRRNLDWGICGGDARSIGLTGLELTEDAVDYLEEHLSARAKKKRKTQEGGSPEKAIVID